MYIVILAGGAGTRFWPLSRKLRPKQLMSVFGGKSMLQRTVERILPLKPQGILVITNALQAAETVAQLDYLHDASIEVIAEPVGRNTAPAIALAACIIARRDSAAVMAVLPADHYIRDEETFRGTLLRAQSLAQQGFLVTLGIKPDRPETGYGYVEAGGELCEAGSYQVTHFAEKPVLAKALEYLAADNYYWNSGMFVWQTQAVLCELEQCLPDLCLALQPLRCPDVGAQTALEPLLEAIYGEIKSESIDYGVMEKAGKVAVIIADFGWSDVGSWGALPEVIPSDAAGHVAINARELISIDAVRCLAYGGDKLVALVGVKDLIVVNTPDALLVCAADRAQEVKKVVETLVERGFTEYL